MLSLVSFADCHCLVAINDISVYKNIRKKQCRFLANRYMPFYTFTYNVKTYILERLYSWVLKFHF